ncbi:MAG: hypothetical protein I3J03_03725, partial [Actinomyces succiniciruminis]|nr:hypothetical protein [Actinomyces succiniciruminis]
MASADGGHIDGDGPDHHNVPVLPAVSYQRVDLGWGQAVTTKGYEVEYAAVAAGARLDAPVSVPRWLESAVFYQVFPERFCNGDPSNDPAYVEPWGGVPTRENFFGGDLQGITQHLDHIQSLGANALYLTPVFTAGTNHRYDGEDYFAIDPVLG